MAGAVRKFARPRKVIDRLLPVLGDMHRTQNAGFVEGVLQEKDIILIIFDMQDMPYRRVAEPPRSPVRSVKNAPSSENTST